MDLAPDVGDGSKADTRKYHRLVRIGQWLNSAFSFKFQECCTIGDDGNVSVSPILRSSCPRALHDSP